MMEKQVQAKERRPFRRADIIIPAVVALLLFVVSVLIGWGLSGRTLGEGVWLAWSRYKANHAVIAPLLTLSVAGYVAWVGLRQLKVGQGQLNTARERHEAQTEADFQRRITESFAKAAEQLGSDKTAVRLGGIYTLERISQESPDDYWPVVETLTAFVRERARWKGDEDAAVSGTVAGFYQGEDPPDDRREPPTDVAAVLTVLMRRNRKNRKREKRKCWRLDLRSTDLRGAHLRGVHFEKAKFQRAHLEGAYLRDAHLQEADFLRAHFEGAIMIGAQLQGAYLPGAHLEDAHLPDARLDGAKLHRAHFKGAKLYGAHLEGADLRDADGLEQAQIDMAHGDAKTRLPGDLCRPAHWTPAV